MEGITAFAIDATWIGGNFAARGLVEPYDRRSVLHRRSTPLRHPAGRKRDPRPDHHRPGDADPLRRDRPRRLAGLGQRPALERRLPLPRPLRPHRAGDHRRLPPPPHPPRLQGEALAARRCWRSSARRRSRARSSPGSPTTASTMPSPTNSETRTAPTSTTATAGAVPCAASSTPTSAGSSSTPSAATRSVSRRTCSRTRSISWVDRTFICWAIGGLLLPFFARLDRRRHPLRRLHRPALGGARPRLRPAPLHLQHQLALPRLRQPRLRDDRRVAQPGADRDPHPRRGMAQQPPCLPDLRHPRPRPLPARRLRPGHRRAREARPGLGRRPGLPGAHVGQGNGPSRALASSGGNRSTRGPRRRSGRESGWSRG